jgi:flagellar protein FliS
MMANPYEYYKTQSVSLATPGKLVVMLFDAAIKNILLADLAMKERQISVANSKLILCQDIFQELINSLDQRYPISADLINLYEFINNKLVEANMKKNRNILREILPIITELRDTWEEAERQARIQGSSAV